MIALYMKNTPRGEEPRYDFVRVVSQKPLQIRGYRIDRMEGPRLIQESIPDSYLSNFRGWYHPATCWEIEEYRRLGGSV
jgi:hypothetical protein